MNPNHPESDLNPDFSRMMNNEPIIVSSESRRSFLLKTVRPIQSTEASVLYFFILYVVISLPVALITRRLITLMMIWNCFLALLPLAFALQFRKPGIGSWRHNGPFALLWLLFFPNSPYMMTDLIHLSSYSFYAAPSRGAVVFSSDPAVWLSLLQISIGVLFGSLSGMLSMSLIHRHLTHRLGMRRANFIIVLISLISGYAIFIGRFLRFNSWDIIHPLRLFAQLSTHLNAFSASISLLFTGYILLSYWLFCTFTDLKK
jgi:Predicted membrane protein